MLDFTRRTLTITLACLPLLFGQSTANAAPKLKIGLNAGSVSVAGVFIGIDKHLFEQEGLDAEVVYFDDPTLITAAVVSGDITVGFLGLAAGTYNSAGNGDLKLIGMALDEKAGYRSLAIITGTKLFDGGLTSTAGMKGRRIGINALGSSTQYAAATIATKQGFQLTNQNFVPLGPLPNIISAIKSEAIDFGVIPGPFAVAAEKAGNVKIVAWVGDETQFDLVGIFSRADAGQHDALVRFMRAYIRAMAMFDNAFQTAGANGQKSANPEAEELLQIISKGARAPVAAFRDALPYLVPDASINAQSIQAQIDFWKELRMTPANVTAAQVIYPSILTEASRK